jgi:hypothetical protein
LKFFVGEFRTRKEAGITATNDGAPMSNKKTTHSEAAGDVAPLHELDE